MATGYISPYGNLVPPLPPPFPVQPAPATLTVPAPVPDLPTSRGSTIDLDQQQTEIVVEPPTPPAVETPLVVPKKRGRKPKKSLASDDEDDADFEAIPVETRKSTDPIIKIDETEETPATATRSKSKRTRSTSPNTTPLTRAPPKKRPYTKRSEKWSNWGQHAGPGVHKAAARAKHIANMDSELEDADASKNNASGATIDEIQELRDRVKALEEQQVLKPTKTSVDINGEDMTFTIVHTLRKEDMRDIIRDKVMSDSPRQFVNDMVQAAQVASIERAKLEQPRHLSRTMTWLNGGSDVSIEDDIGGDLLGEASDDDVEMAKSGPRTKAVRRRPRTTNLPPPRAPSSRMKKPTKHSLSPSVDDADEYSDSSEDAPLFVPILTAGPRKNCQVGILKKKPHNVVTCGFDNKGRLNWRVLKQDREGNTVGCPNGPGTKREYVDLHPTLVNLSEDAFRVEIHRRQTRLEAENAADEADKAAEKAAAASSGKLPKFRKS